MKRTYIPSEYNKTDIFGSVVTKEYKTFFGTPLVKLPFMISLLKDSIIYYQNINTEQLDIKKESLLSANILNVELLKKENITYIIDNNGDIIFTIEYKKILTSYILAILKKNRVFNGLTIEMTQKNDINLFITEYINDNILNKYSNIVLDLYIEYTKIENNGNIGVFSFDSNIESEVNYTNKYTINIYDNHLTLKLKPLVNLLTHTFNYYYNIKTNR